MLLANRKPEFAVRVKPPHFFYMTYGDLRWEPGARYRILLGVGRRLDQAGHMVGPLLSPVIANRIKLDRHYQAKYKDATYHAPARVPSSRTIEVRWGQCQWL